MKRIESLVERRFFDDIAYYKEQLQRWNAIHNMTAIKNERELDDFIVDAVVPLEFLGSVDSLLDIGTGAGFPGLILAVARREWRVVLVEPITKRASFLQFIKASLKLENVTVQNARIEQLASEPFSLITSRAVTDTKLLLHLAKPFCDAHTRLLFYKGERVYDEVDTRLDYEIIKSHKRHYLYIKSCQ